MMHQIDIYGVFVPTLGVLALAIAPVHFLLRRVFAAIGLYRFVWHKPLFDLALYICILGIASMILTGAGVLNRLAGLGGRMIVTLDMVACAAVLGHYLWRYYMDAPWTRNGHVRADVVGVAPDVSGPVQDVAVQDNQIVKAGDVLFQIDRSRYELALRTAQASVDSAYASFAQARADMERTTGWPTRTSPAGRVPKRPKHWCFSVRRNTTPPLLRVTWPSWMSNAPRCAPRSTAGSPT